MPVINSSVIAPTVLVRPTYLDKLFEHLGTAANAGGLVMHAMAAQQQSQTQNSQAKAAALQYALTLPHDGTRQAWLQNTGLFNKQELQSALASPDTNADRVKYNRDSMDPSLLGPTGSSPQISPQAAPSPQSTTPYTNASYNVNPSVSPDAANFGSLLVGQQLFGGGMNPMGTPNNGGQ